MGGGARKGEDPALRKHETQRLNAGEMAQGSGTLPALAEDMVWFPALTW